MVERTGSWDAIVIGSGMAGLTTAAYLSTAGLRTLVLEQDDTAGGCSQVFRRRRQFEFDVGLHYLGDCGPDGSIPQMLRGVGLDGRVTFLEMDEDGFDTLVFPDLTFRVPRGLDRYLERLVDTCPEDEEGLRRCLGILDAVGREADRLDPPRTREDIRRFRREAPNVIAWGGRTLEALFDECGLGPRSRAIISAQSASYGAPPSRVSVAVHASLLFQVVERGGYDPKGGGQVLAAHLVDVIHAHGGRVRTRARVARIDVDGGQVTGVHLADGERFHAPVVAASGDIKRTLLDLVDPSQLRRDTLETVRGFRMAPAFLTVYLGLDIDLADRMPNTNLWVHQSYDAELPYDRAAAGVLPDALSPAEQFVYITSGTRKDAGTARLAPPGMSTMELMTIVPADRAVWARDADPSAWSSYRRDPGYQALKERMSEALVARAEQLLPGLRDHIVWQEVATPLTHERYTLGTAGACYGIELAADQTGHHRPVPQTEVAGLFLAGVSTFWGNGIVGAMRSGVGCASAILQRDLRREVADGAVFGDPSRLTAGGPGWDPLLACRRLSVKPRARRALAL